MKGNIYTKTIPHRYAYASPMRQKNRVNHILFQSSMSMEQNKIICKMTVNIFCCAQDMQSINQTKNE